MKTEQMHPETVSNLYLLAKDVITKVIEKLPADQSEHMLTAFQIAWNEAALEQMGSAWVAGIYDAALEEVENAAPSRLN
jgi:hypothetical protein